jgi:hypothetical protein
MAMKTERTAVDIEALERAFKFGCEENEAYRTHLENIARQSGWDAAAESAVYHFQIRGLRPWECPPSSCAHIDVVNEHVYGAKRKEIALRKRLLKAGLSLFEPFAVEALKEAERKRRAVRRAADRKGGSERDGHPLPPESPPPVA